MTTLQHIQQLEEALNSYKSPVVGFLAGVGIFSLGVTAIALYSIFVLMAIEFLEQHGIVAEFQSGGIAWTLQYAFSYPAYLMLVATVASIIQRVRSLLGRDLETYYTQTIWHVVLGVAAIGAAIEVAILS